MSKTLDDTDIAVMQQNTKMLEYDSILYISNSLFGILQITDNHIDNE